MTCVYNLKLRRCSFFLSHIFLQVLVGLSKTNPTATNFDYDITKKTAFAQTQYNFISFENICIIL